MKSWLSRLSAIAVGVLFCTDCHSTSAPTAPAPLAAQFPLHLAGRVTDNISRPLAGAVVQASQPSGVMTITDSDGNFLLSDPTLVVSVTLQIIKNGYTPVQVTIPNKNDTVRFSMMPVDLLTLDGAYSVTFTAAESCTGLPPAARKRTYVARFQSSSGSKALVVALLSGADFMPFYDTLSGNVSNDAALFHVASWDADNAWGDDEPIIERLDPNSFVSFDGQGTSVSVTSALSIAATLNGTIAYCAMSQAPEQPNWPLTCARGALVECKSSQHQMLLTRQ